MFTRIKQLNQKECMKNSNEVKEKSIKNSSIKRTDLSKIQTNYFYICFITYFIDLNKVKSSIKINLIILYLIITISILPHVSSSKEGELRKLNGENNYIFITIEGTGPHSIINDTFTSLLTSLEINNAEITGTISNVQEMNSETNRIKLYFNVQLNTCSNMFKKILDITIIDLTNLDFSFVTDMESFFEGCSSLKSVNFSDINALDVINMKNMFKIVVH